MAESDQRGPTLIKCIYCGEDKPPSMEHVLQKSLGGNLTTNLVCAGCNSGLSPIDQSLAEMSILSLARVGNAAEEQFPTYLGGETVRISEDGHWEEVRVLNRLKLEILPQIRLELDQDGKPLKIAFAGSIPEEMHKLIELIDKKISKHELSKIHQKLGDLIKSREPRIVLHRHKDLFIRASTEENAREFINALTRTWPSIYSEIHGKELTVETAPPGVVNVQISIKLDHNFRAIAKIAYNLLAVSQGGAFVLQDEFKPLRDYIRGTDKVYKESDDSDETPLEAKFVRFLAPEEKAPLETDKHLVILAYIYPTLCGFVTLYGSSKFFIRLADIELTNFILEAWEFSTDRTAHSKLDFMEIFQRMRGVWREPIPGRGWNH